MFSHRSSSFLTFSSNTFSVNSRLLLKSHISLSRFFISFCDFLISSIVILKFALIKFPIFFSCFSNSFLNIFRITFIFSSLKKVLASAILILFGASISLATPQFNPNSPLTKKLLSSLVESSASNISIDTPTTHDRVKSYFNNSNDIFQSEVLFEKLKVTKLKNDLLDDLRVEIKDIIKKELESLHTNSTHSTTNYITEIKSLKRELDIKERMITQLLNTVKEISTVNITQSTNPRPIFTCENETKASNISDMITNQSERKRSIDLTSNNSTVTNSEALKVSLSEQLKNVKRQKQEEFYQFKSKQAIDNNINESLSKQKHQGLYPSGTTVIVGDSIINGVIEERINKKDRPVKVRNFPGATVADMEHYLIPVIQKIIVTLLYTSGQTMLRIYHPEQS